MENRNWLVSYPRSGSTWVRLLFANLLHPEVPRGYKDVDYMVPDFHAVNRLNWDLVRKHTERLLLVKSHHPMIDAYSEEPCIYIYRDPRDVVVSEYHFELWETGKEFSFDEFFTRFVRGETKFESWKLHVTLWTKSGNTDLKHLVKYEDLWKDPFLEFSRMCDFLSYYADDFELLDAIDKCEFQKCVERSPKDNIDPRKRGLHGRPGKWRSVLTPSQQDEMWAWAGGLMERLGYGEN